VTLVRAPDEGQRSEVWMMREDSGEFLAVFKPRRNDVSFVKGEGYLKEPAAWIADALSSSQAGVPVTFCVEIKVANTTLEGSAQAFIAEGFDGNDYRYSGGSLHQEGAERLAVSDMRLANSVRGSHLDGRDILSLSTVLYKCCSLIFDLGHVKYERGIPWLDLYQNICTHKANQNKSWLYSRKLKIQLTPRSRPNRKMIRVRPWQT